MEPIIKKAVEGGWIFQRDNHIFPLFDGVSNNGETAMFTDEHGENGIWVEEQIKVIVCDPLFWQALGKACGWSKSCSRCGNTLELKHRESNLFVCWSCMEDMGDEVDSWKYHALRFHEINLTEGWEKAVASLQEVTK